MPKELPPRKKIVAAIQASENGCTMDELVEASGLDDEKAVKAQFKYIRYADLFPFENEDDLWILLDEDEWDKIQESKPTKSTVAKPKFKNINGKRRSLNVRYDTTMARTTTANAALAKKSDDIVLRMKKQIADLNFLVAKEEMRRYKTAVIKELGVSMDAFDDMGDPDAYYDEVFKQRHPELNEEPTEMMA